MKYASKIANSMNISMTFPPLKTIQATFRVALTGGIGSGKSAVAKILEKMGAEIIDFDKISHEITNSGGAAIPEIVEAFGLDFILPNGSLNRGKMRDEIICNPISKAKLESITHPLINHLSEKMLNVINLQANAPYVVLVVPLLIESGAWLHQNPSKVDFVVVVDCSEELQVSRVQNRSHLDKSTVLEIMSHQVSRADRLREAQFIINNDKDFEYLEIQCINLHKRILEKSCQKR